MPGSAINDLLKLSFPVSNKQDWSRVASQEIQGKNADEILSWKSEDGLAFLPYYDQTDIENLRYLKDFELSPSPDPYAGSRAWKNLPRVSVIAAAKSNLVAREHLSHGADGIFFDFSDVNVVGLKTLLENINWPYCHIAFLAESTPQLTQLIVDHIEEQKFDPSLITGTLFWRNAPLQGLDVLNVFSKATNFQSLGILINSSSPVKQISEALTRAVNLMDQLTDQGVSKDIIWRNINVSLPSGIDFLTEVSKLRALRLLWYQVAQAFEISNYAPADLRIHVRSQPWIVESFQPHGNMLKGTTAALSAILGGCDTLTIEPEDELHPTMNRVARNVSTILREESQLNSAADAVSGSYAIEYMVDKIAAAAWKQFQSEIKPS